MAHRSQARQGERRQPQGGNRDNENRGQQAERGQHRNGNRNQNPNRQEREAGRLDENEELDAERE